MVLANKTDRLMEQNRNPRNNSHVGGQLLFDMSQEYLLGKEQSLNTWCWEKWISKCKSTKLDLYTIY